MRETKLEECHNKGVYLLFFTQSYFEHEWAFRRYHSNSCDFSIYTYFNIKSIPEETAGFAKIASILFKDNRCNLHRTKDHS